MFERLRQLIVEIHRRSLWQVLVVYLGASWGVLEAVDHVVERYLLPEWVSGAAVVLLLIGLPIVLATAMVRESSTEATGETGVRDPTLLAPREGVPEGSAGGGWGSSVPESIARFLTWPKAVLAGLLAFAGLAAVSAFIVLRGVPRIAQASGMAGAAFEERAWIVMAEFEAPPEQAEIGAAAGTALRVDLEQSAYLNVYSREQVAPVLRRMGLPDWARRRTRSNAAARYPG